MSDCTYHASQLAEQKRARIAQKLLAAEIIKLLESYGVKVIFVVYGDL